MMLSLLDTSALIELHRIEISGPTAISVLSIAELEHGVLAAGDPDLRAERLTRLNHLLTAYQPLHVTDLVASSYALLADATDRAGLKARTRHMDLLIAATAHANNARLVTCNGSDVRHLRDVLTIVEV